MMTLDEIPIGCSVRILKLHIQAQEFRHRLLAMGLTPGVVMTVLCVAPLGDPIQVMLRGYTLSLRKKECHQIEVEYAHGNYQQDDGFTQAMDHCACR